MNIEEIFNDAIEFADFGIKFENFSESSKFATIMTLLQESSDEIKAKVLVNLLDIL